MNAKESVMTTEEVKDEAVKPEEVVSNEETKQEEVVEETTEVTEDAEVDELPNSNEKKEDEDNKKDKKNYLLYAIILILLLLLAFCFWSMSKKDNKVTSDQLGTRGNITMTTGEDDVEEEGGLENRRVFFAGLTDSELSKGDVIRLRNLKANNDFVMKYEIYNTETNKLIYETDFIESDKYLQWDPYEQLEPGEYTVSIKEIPYAIVDGNEVPLTAGANTIKIKLN